ncbi:MAG: polyphenol oxidase family protein [Chthoniobacterales bacterium]
MRPSAAKFPRVLQEAALPFEQFAALADAECVHAFVHRAPGVDVSYDKKGALARLDDVHRQVRFALNLESRAFITAEQVHGDGLAVIDQPIHDEKCFSACDGLITNQRDVCLGIYVADCCAVYLVDPVRHALGLVHSGKKGTELGIVGRAIDLMTEHFGTVPQDLVAQLSPCIRPPHYEIDFAAEIARACRERGLTSVDDGGACTACDLARYYSYRAEKGRTGRMLAFLALA